jgi:hypothetical protein
MTGAVTAAGTLVTAVVWLDDGGERWLAVLDGHSSVDVWRKVPGFLNEEGR